jgi:ABC-type transport system involved in multi-copper enzyme maturation permease subunit
MIRVIRSELARLKSPSFILGGAGLMTFFGLMATAILFITATSGSGVSLPRTEGVTVAMLEASDGMFAGLQNFVSMLGIVALVIWAMAVTSDYSSGLIRLLVQAEPSRWRLLGGKVVALVAFTCLATLVTVVAVVVAAPALASATGISTDAWTQDVARTLVSTYVQVTASVLLWGLVGLFVGMLTRSTGVAIGIGIGYLLVFEGLASMLLEGASKWLPGSAFSAIASGGSADMSFGTAVMVGAAYAAAALAVAAVTFARRDITA